MTRILGIDPGYVLSAFVLVDPHDLRPVEFGKIPNDELLAGLVDGRLRIATRIVCEKIESFGMPVGREIFETVFWTGRFVQAALPVEVERIGRKRVVRHHCYSAQADDSNVTHALVDRFTPGAPNFGKGTKAEPGWFYGFAGDVWQAYALAVYTADESDRKGR